MLIARAVSTERTWRRVSSCNRELVRDKPVMSYPYTLSFPAPSYIEVLVAVVRAAARYLKGTIASLSHAIHVMPPAHGHHDMRYIYEDSLGGPGPCSLPSVLPSIVKRRSIQLPQHVLLVQHIRHELRVVPKLVRIHLRGRGSQSHVHSMVTRR